MKQLIRNLGERINKENLTNAYVRLDNFVEKKVVVPAVKTLVSAALIGSSVLTGIGLSEKYLSPEIHTQEQLEQAVQYEREMLGIPREYNIPSELTNNFPEGCEDAAGICQIKTNIEDNTFSQEISIKVRPGRTQNTVAHEVYHAKDHIVDPVSGRYRGFRALINPTRGILDFGREFPAYVYGFTRVDVNRLTGRTE